MTNDSEPTPTNQPNSEPTTASSDDRDLQWNDTIDDWDAVLEGDQTAVDTPSAESGTTERQSADSETTQMEPTWGTTPDRSGQTPSTDSSSDDDSSSSSSSDSGSGSSTSTGDRSSSRSSGSERTPSESRRSDGGETVSSTATDGSPEFVRIDPISDSLLKTTAQVLPEAWLADTEVQQLIQWVVYSFMEETDPEMSTGDRAQVAIHRAAARTSANAPMIRQLCTTSLYRGQSGTPADNFHADLETVQHRLATGSVAASD